jgi:hypothetical protein
MKHLLKTCLIVLILLSIERKLSIENDLINQVHISTKEFTNNLPSYYVNSSFKILLRGHRHSKGTIATPHNYNNNYINKLEKDNCFKDFHFVYDYVIDV